MAFIDKIKRPRVIIAVCAAVVVLLILFPLNSGLVWITDIGGRGDDRFESVVQAPGGGFVAVGYSQSSYGDIPGNKGSDDAIIAKFTENGRLVWIKNIGGSDFDQFRSVVQTPDGGFVAVGTTWSHNGDIPGKKGKLDAIIAKFTEDGDLVWIKNVGGSGRDVFWMVISAPDNSFVAVGNSSSNDGDIPGHKGSSETYDALIARFDESGELVWIKNVGGSKGDRFNAVVLAPDGSFVAVGVSLSSFGVFSLNKGSEDAIIAKFNVR